MNLDSILAFGVPGGWEWGAIIFIVLLLFGAKKLPELARGLGKSVGEFRRAKDEFTTELEKASQPELPQPKNTVSHSSETKIS